MYMEENRLLFREKKDLLKIVCRIPTSAHLQLDCLSFTNVYISGAGMWSIRESMIYRVLFSTKQINWLHGK